MAANSGRKRSRPAATPEARENQLISLASDLVERRFRDGTASAQETVFFLKAGSSRERLEHQKLQNENLLLSARVGQITEGKQMAVLYADALNAMREYQGEEPQYSDEDDGYYDGR
jgi:hypothetical protein